MELDNILDSIGNELAGLECYALVGRDGLALVQKNLMPDIDITTLIVEFSTVFNTTKKAACEIGDHGFLSSIHSLANHHIILHEISDTEYFCLVCLRTSDGNIGKAKYILKKYEDKIKEELS